MNQLPLSILVPIPYTKNGDWTGGSWTRTPTKLDAHGSGCPKKQVLKTDFGCEATMVLSPTRHPTQIIRSRLVLGGDEKWGLAPWSFPSCNWVWHDMGVYLFLWDAHSPLYHVDRERTTMPIIWISWRKSVWILTMGMPASSLRWMICSRRRGPEGQLWVWDLVWNHSWLAGRLFTFLNWGNYIRWIGNERGHAGDP